MPWTIRPETFENLLLSHQKTLNSVQYYLFALASWPFCTEHKSIPNIKKMPWTFAPRPLEIWYCLIRRPWIQFNIIFSPLRRGLFIQDINRPKTSKKCFGLFAPRLLKNCYCLIRRPWIQFNIIFSPLSRGLFIQDINRPKTSKNALDYSPRDLWKFAIVSSEDLEFSSILFFRPCVVAFLYRT